MARRYQELRDRMTPEQRARSDGRLLELLKEMPLQQLRKARHLTQATLAETMEMSQGDLSRLEQRTDCYVSTLRKYVEAMGGELEIVARFGDGEAVKITQFRELQ